MAAPSRVSGSVHWVVLGRAEWPPERAFVKQTVVWLLAEPGKMSPRLGGGGTWRQSLLLKEDLCAPRQHCDANEHEHVVELDVDFFLSFFLCFFSFSLFSTCLWENPLRGCSVKLINPSNNNNNEEILKRQTSLIYFIFVSQIYSSNTF